MGWGEDALARHRHGWNGWRAEGTGQRDVIGGEGADANRRSYSTSALARYVAGPRFLINNNHTIFSRRQPAIRASGIGPYDKTLFVRGSTAVLSSVSRSLNISQVLDRCIEFPRPLRLSLRCLLLAACIITRVAGSLP
jgi:hypothetical protein